MAKHTLIGSEAAACELAGLLNGASRKRPAVVVTIAAGQAESYIDAAEIAHDLDGLADVYLIATGPHTWAFSEHMSAGTEVYGGAGRVYPVGHDWVHDVALSPLRFAWRAEDGPAATRRLIDDGLGLAAAAGLLGTTASPSRGVRREGKVKRAENERAWVDFSSDPGTGGFNMGVVPPQLAEPDLPIERVLQPGMTVQGNFDPESRWFDIREGRVPPAQALAGYQIGEVVLAEIVQVQAEYAVGRLLPSVTFRLARADVTPDDANLRTLLTKGEIVTARILGTSPWWLTLLGIDEEPLEAPSIYPGGPPWLLPPAEFDPAFEEDDAGPDASSEASGAADPASGPASGPAGTPAIRSWIISAVPAVPGSSAPDAKREKPVFSPAQMPARRGEGVRPVAVPAAASTVAREAPSAVDELRARAVSLEHRVRGLEQELKGVRRERQQLETLKNDAERHASRLETELKRSRSALRKARGGKHADVPEFADAERGFRYLVETAWARRIPVGEQPARPLPDYVIGDEFFASVEATQGVTIAKVADVVMELLTGYAESSAGRDMHHLRTGASGDAPFRQRSRDDAMCWRIALQVGTPSARRLHAWRLPDGRWELSSVRKHDDFEP